MGTVGASKGVNVFETILVPTDLEGASNPGLDRAIELARASGGRIVAVHVMSSASIDVAEVPHEAKPLREQAESRARSQLESLLQEHAPDLSSDMHVVFGSPAEEIRRLADDASADLVVITVKNRSRIGKLLLGSQAQEIILTSKVPVLCVPRT